jgi:phosphotriesterase-related protein
VLRAAVAASFATGATIGSHTMNGAVARAQLDIIERAGGSPDRFVWIHAHAEPDRAIHLELAGAAAGSSSMGSGILPRIRTSSTWPETCWTPDSPTPCCSVRIAAGSTQRSRAAARRCRTRPGSRFIPSLADHGVDEATITTSTRHNPFRAFAR